MATLNVSVCDHYYWQNILTHTHKHNQLPEHK